jgi:hypothetical protein
MASYFRDEASGEFIERGEWEAINGKVPRRKSRSSACQILEEFASPIDGSRIGDYKQLSEHNEKHGVTNIADYSPGYFEKRGKEMKAEATGQTPEAKQERKQLIDKTLTDFGV